MGLLSNRKKSSAPEETYIAAPTVQETRQSSEQDLAAAKIAAVARGKKARFAEAEKQQAAQKIQAIRRGNKPTRADAGKQKAAAQAAPLKRQLSRRVSFGSIKIDANALQQQPGKSPLEELQDALAKCTAGLSIQLPCWAPPADPLAKAVDFSAAPSSVTPPEPQPEPAPPPATADHDHEDEVPIGDSKLASAPVEKDYSGGTSDTKKKLLSDGVFNKVKALFDKIDDDGNGEITKDEANKFWKKNFAKVNAQAMFNEVDDEGDGAVTFAKWIAFWENVVNSGYNEEDLLEELDSIIEGGSWVDFDDNRTT